MVQRRHNNIIYNLENLKIIFNRKLNKPRYMERLPNIHLIPEDQTN